VLGGAGSTVLQRAFKPITHPSAEFYRHAVHIDLS
jgi:hypothetical protein